MNKPFRVLVPCIALLANISGLAMRDLQTDNPNPPGEVVKLIFIHHSTGENWLRDEYGNLGRRLGENNYFVSDTNYGWGPDAIGDRTDIPNWTEWFRSENTPVYMDALFNESGQNSSYARWLEDPGGENQIVIFKSCFPNSALEGSPDDPPGEHEELSVSGAKYVYTHILGYFATRPDKLFVVISAPPLSDPSYAENARAFNQWLMNDWLADNNYTLPNVVVFDFYNLLTDQNAHHRISQGQVEYIRGSSDTLHYPSEDDHPSSAGSQKASDEFVPLLNSFYHHWQDAGHAEQDQAENGPAPQAGQGSMPAAELIDDFERGPLAGTEYWHAFLDEATSTTAACSSQGNSVHSGTQSLQFEFNVAPNSWATCALFYETAQDWSAGEGLAFDYHANPPGLAFDVDLYAGVRDDRQTYLYTIESPAESSDGWLSITLNWEDFHRADWEADAGTAFSQPEQIIGLAFGLNALPDSPNTGSLWIDDIQLAGYLAAPEAAPPEPEQSTKPGRLLPCAGAIGVPLGLAGMGLLRKIHMLKSVEARK